MTFDLILKNKLSRGEQLFCEPLKEKLAFGATHKIPLRSNLMHDQNEFPLFTINALYLKNPIKISAGEFVEKMIRQAFLSLGKDFSLDFVQNALREVHLIVKPVHDPIRPLSSYHFEMQKVIVRQDYYQLLFPKNPPRTALGEFDEKRLDNKISESDFRALEAAVGTPSLLSHQAGPNTQPIDTNNVPSRSSYENRALSTKVKGSNKKKRVAPYKDSSKKSNSSQEIDPEFLAEWELNKLKMMDQCRKAYRNEEN